ncbi:MAG: helix-turn-helix transcriptional regulator [Deferribacteres bacterium]|nr:helix-turn-helix domain-containing protein [candidate division KSB1 bacterium]MCB9501664.1 helix-turn-helix transcriptional regulator [Deferribacteres bacterium]
MKALFEYIGIDKSEFLKVRRIVQKNIDIPWHFHPEYEIVVILQGAGHVFIGDGMERYEGGDIFLIGSNVPHVFIDDSHNRSMHDESHIEVVVVQFNGAFISKFFELKEFHRIAALLQKMQCGVKIGDRIKEDIAGSFVMLIHLSGLKRLTEFIHILDAIGKDTNVHLINPTTSASILPNVRSNRIMKVIQYMNNNYHHEINLDQLARLANMETTSFCRFFKHHTRKTFTGYLNELRLGYACKLLMEGSLSVTEICYETGYNSISHFNRQFKRVYDVTPKEYRARFYQHLAPGTFVRPVS